MKRLLASEFQLEKLGQVDFFTEGVNYAPELGALRILAKRNSTSTYPLRHFLVSDFGPSRS